jgi:hypothetical protein
MVRVAHTNHTGRTTVFDEALRPRANRGRRLNLWLAPCVPEDRAPFSIASQMEATVSYISFTVKYSPNQASTSTPSVITTYKSALYSQAMKVIRRHVTPNEVLMVLAMIERNRRGLSAAVAKLSTVARSTVIRKQVKLKNALKKVMLEYEAKLGAVRAWHSVSTFGEMLLDIRTGRVVKLEANSNNSVLQKTEVIRYRKLRAMYRFFRTELLASSQDANVIVRLAYDRTARTLTCSRVRD